MPHSLSNASVDEGDEWRPVLLKCFGRYDLDGSGRIDSMLELEQLTFNACVKCNCGASPSMIDKLLVPQRAIMESGGWDFEQFLDWFLRHFPPGFKSSDPSALKPLPLLPAPGRPIPAVLSKSDRGCCDQFGQTQDMIKFRDGPHSRPPIVVDVHRGSDGLWSLPEVVVFPGDRVRWHWSEPGVLYQADQNGEPEIGGWASSPLPMKTASFTQLFRSQGRFWVGLSTTAHEELTIDPAPCFVRVLLPEVRVKAMVIKRSVLLLLLSVIPTIGYIVGKRSASNLSDQVVDSADLQKYKPLDKLVVDILTDFIPYAFVSFSLFLQYFVVAVAGGLLYLFGKLHRNMKKGGAGFTLRARLVQGCLTAGCCLVLCVSVHYLARQEYELEQDWNEVEAVVYTDVNFQVAQLLSVSAAVGAMTRTAHAYPGFMPVATLDSAQQTLDTLVTQTASVKDYEDMATNVIWVHNQARQVFAFVSFETLLVISALGMSAVVTLRAGVVSAAVRTGILATCVLLMYIGLTVSVYDAVKSGCDEVSDYLHADSLVAAFEVAVVVPPAVYQLFSQCLNQNLTIADFVGTSDFFNSNVDASLSSLSGVVPNSTGIVFPNYSSSSSTNTTPTMDRLVLTTTTTLAQVNAYAQNQYVANLTANSSTSAATNISALTRGLAQAQTATAALGGLLGLLDCSTLKQTLYDTEHLLCQDTLNQAKYIYQLSAGLIVFQFVVILLLVSHGIVMFYPCRHYCCPDYSCMRWFRFKISWRAHRAVGCKHGAACLPCLHYTSTDHNNSVYTFFTLLFVCLSQAILISFLQHNDDMIASSYDMDTQGKAAVVLFCACLLGHFGPVFSLQSLSAWIPLCCCGAGVLFACVAFSIGAKDNYQQISGCSGGLEGWASEILRSSTVQGCSISERTNGMKWTLYYSLSAVFSGMLVLSLLWMWVVRKKVVNAGHQLLIARILNPGGYGEISQIAQRSNGDEPVVDMALEGNPIAFRGLRHGMSSELATSMELQENGLLELKGESVEEPGRSDESESEAAESESEAVELESKANDTDDQTEQADAVTGEGLVRQREYTVWLSATVTLFAVAVCLVPLFWSSGSGKECNGLTELCGRRLNETVFPMAYMSQAAVPAGVFPAQQNFNVTSQLAHGIRAMSVSVWPCQDDSSKPCGCVQDCAIGQQPFEAYLHSVRQFLQNHTSEVVALIISQYVDTAALELALEAAQIDTMAYSPPGACGTFLWPTLNDMLQNGTQVLVFSDNAKNALYGPATTKGWLIPTYDYAWSTSTDAVRASQLDCDAATGTKTSGKLGIMNHVLETAVAVMGTARELNKQANLTSQVQMCTANPNFLSVAFARLGDLVDVTNQLNN